MSFIVSGTGGKLQIVTASAGSVRITASWVKNNAGTITPDGAPVAAITTATTTDLFAAPGASQQSRSKVFAAFNDHATVSNAITIQHTDGTNTSPIWKGTLAVGECVICDANGNFTHYDASGNPILGGSGRYLQTTVLTTGTTFTTRADTRSIKVRMVGGGGGGGGANTAATSGAMGGGGGAGGYAEKTFSVAGSTGYTYAIGGAGAAGAAAGGTGGTGGNTTFTVGATTVTAFGGVGGVGSAAAATALTVLGGAGGAVSTNGDLNVGGHPGDPGIRSSATIGVSGNGAQSEFGAGGIGKIAQSAGAAGTGFGAGGSGGCCINGGAAAAGGAGLAGVIIVEEYS